MAEANQMVVYNIEETIFTAEELSGISRIRERQSEYIVIDCVCTVPKYGDTPGNLKISGDGKLEIVCQCSEPCKRGSLTPAGFAKHAGKPSSNTKWKNHIQVFNKNDERVKLSKTCLLKYHQQPIFLRGVVVHRDEFMECTRCGKKRRFSRRSVAECRAYHDAQANPNWTCFDMEKPCEDEKERDSRLCLRGCPREPKCRGCEYCSCVGCFTCRFSDCDCRDCVDYCQNAIAKS